MITMLPHPGPDVVASKASGALTTEDHQQKLIPALERKLRQETEVAWYFELEDFSGRKLGALWEDFSYGVEHANDFRKIAIVGGCRMGEVDSQADEAVHAGRCEVFPAGAEI